MVRDRRAAPNEELIAESYRGIRPAFGYPACPDHSEKRTLFDLLEAEAVGIELTESFAMTPGASVSGLYFGHPAARYFSVGRIARDQVEDYAARKGAPLAEIEHGLRPTWRTTPTAGDSQDTAENRQGRRCPSLSSARRLRAAFLHAGL